MSSKTSQRTEQTVLDVAIIGAGIAGLTAAIGLGRAGHHVDVYERSTFANEVGAAIHVCPNASRVLIQWGFDFTRAKAVVVKKGRILNGTTLAKAYSGDYDDMPEKFGAPWYFLHRVDLHTELKRLAQEITQIHVSSEVTHADCTSGEITFANGTTVTKDLIIAADGVHSSIVKEVQGDIAIATETGQSAFRFLIPTEKIASIGQSEALFGKESATFTAATDPKRRLVWYPCRNGELQNFAAIHPDRRQGNEIEAWNVAASLDDLLDEYKDFHPALVEACRHAEDLKLWKLLYREPNPTWVRGKIALCGDAAHPMLPHQGQGGAQAIEDGAALGALFQDLDSKDQVSARLHMYQEVRFTRAAAIQIFSNAGQEESEKIKDQAQKYVKGPIPSNQHEFHQYNFSHDVMEASRALLRKYNQDQVANSMRGTASAEPLSLGRNSASSATTSVAV